MRGLMFCDQVCRMGTSRIRPILRRSYTTTRWTALALLATVAVTAYPLRAQGVLVAPTALVLTESRRSATVTLVNTGTKTSDVSIALAFGVPQTDSLGQMHLVLSETPDAHVPSAVPLLSVYPARVLLPPGATRIVRVVATADLPARHEHWARLVVTSRDARRPVSSGDSSVLTGTPGEANALNGGASVALALEVRSILGIFYRPSDASTALDASAASAELRGAQLATRITLTRSGNAAYVGTLRALLKDQRGTTLQEKQLPLGVYYSLSPGVAFDATTLAAGTYRVVWQATTDRPDVPRALLTPAAPVGAEVEVRVP
jgi:P pilus assembly chaperone PapD